MRNKEKEILELCRRETTVVHIHIWDKKRIRAFLYISFSFFFLCLSKVVWESKVFHKPRWISICKNNKNTKRDSSIRWNEKKKIRVESLSVFVFNVCVAVLLSANLFLKSPTRIDIYMIICTRIVCLLCVIVSDYSCLSFAEWLTKI